MKMTSVLRRCRAGGLAVALCLGSSPLGAQTQRPLAPLPDGDLRVAPFFDGWYSNPDGSFTLSFGYSNLNRDDVVEIPLGPDNFIEPKEFDGGQPTSFPPVIPDEGAPGPRRDRERGVFTITVPAGFRGDVVWTLRYRGQTHSVPGSAKTGAYQLRWPMAMGSAPPLLRFAPGGPAGRGPSGIQAEPMKASPGAALPLTVWFTDDSVREEYSVPIRQRKERPPMNVTWYKHAGPGPVVFSARKAPITTTEGSAATSATFEQPGDYVIRVRVDSFGRLDSSPGDQCCWTNGYVKVTVEP